MTLPEYDPASEQGYTPIPNGMLACTNCGSLRYRCARCGNAIGTDLAPATGGPHRLPAPFGSRSTTVDVTVCDPCHAAIVQQVDQALPWRPDVDTPAPA